MSDKDFPSLPSGLPSGRLIAPNPNFTEDADRKVLWVSDEELPGLGELWCRLYDERARTGLYPLLLDTLQGEPGRPWHEGELGFIPVKAIDALDVDETLCGFLDRYTEFPGWPYPAGWPGLAASGTGAADPDEHARATVRQRTERSAWLLGLVPAARGADALTLSGWDGPVNHAGDTAAISAVVRSWEDRFGARVTAVGYAELYLSVAAPPTALEHARGVAAEHFVFCPDNIWQGGTDFEKYAAGLVRATEWRFWWD